MMMLQMNADQIKEEARSADFLIFALNLQISISIYKGRFYLLNEIIG